MIVIAAILWAASLMAVLFSFYLVYRGLSPETKEPPHAPS